MTDVQWRHICIVIECVIVIETSQSVAFVIGHNSRLRRRYIYIYIDVTINWEMGNIAMKNSRAFQKTSIVYCIVTRYSSLEQFSYLSCVWQKKIETSVIINLSCKWTCINPKIIYYTNLFNGMLLDLWQICRYILK